MMPYNSHQSQSKNAKKNVFNYVLWSMDQPMSKEDDAIKYYRQFLDLTKPLLDTCGLDDEDCNKLFWYGFHPEDRAMLLCWLRSENPNW
jgi:hypothetical protein